MRIRTLDLVKLVIALVTSATLIAMMLPVAAGAAGTLMTIVDSDSNSQAQVDGGKLRVGDGDGKLSIDGTVLERATMKGRTPFRDGCGETTGQGDGQASCQFAAVPAGKTLIVTTLSMQTWQPSDQSIYNGNWWVDLEHFYPTNVMIGINGTKRYTSFSFAGELALTSGEILNAGALRANVTGEFVMGASVFGYLVDNV